MNERSEEVKRVKEVDINFFFQVQKWLLTDEAGVGGVNLRFLTEIHNSFDILPTQISPNRGEYVIHPGKGGTF